MMTTAPPVHLYQIAYSPQSLAAVEPGYRVLDNLDNPRPDWYEYWPVRRFLLNEALDEQAYYGFFSPKFGAKTQLSSTDVTHFVQSHGTGFDVFLFSPQPDMGAFFLNVFEQAETFDPGLIDAFDAYLRHIGKPLPLRNIVMDSRQTVFSNYFIARPEFWREWLILTEPFFNVCEGPDSPLKLALTRPTNYSEGASQEGASRKVFLLERMASLLLYTQPRWRTKAANPFGFGWSMSRFRDHPMEAYISDALKVAFREQGFPQYIEAFSYIRNRFAHQAKD